MLNTRSSKEIGETFGELVEVARTGNLPDRLDIPQTQQLIEEKRARRLAALGELMDFVKEPEITKRLVHGATPSTEPGEHIFVSRMASIKAKPLKYTYPGDIVIVQPYIDVVLRYLGSEIPGDLKLQISTGRWSDRDTHIEWTKASNAYIHEEGTTLNNAEWFKRVVSRMIPADNWDFQFDELPIYPWYHRFHLNGSGRTDLRPEHLLDVDFLYLDFIREVDNRGTMVLNEYAEGSLTSQEKDTTLLAIEDLTEATGILRRGRQRLQ